MPTITSSNTYIIASPFQVSDEHTLSITYTADTAAKLIGYCNTSEYPRACAGDTINVAANVDVSATPLNPQAGVTIDMQGYTVTGQFSQDSGGDYAPLKLINGTVDSSGLASSAPAGSSDFGANQFENGCFEFDGVTFTGDNHSTGKNMLTFYARTHPVIAVMNRCHAEEAYLDCISCKAVGTLGAASSLKLYDCEANNAGSSTVANQALTTHDGFAIYDYNGYYHTPEYAGTDAQVIAPGAATDTIILNGTKTSGGVVWAAEAYNCDITMQNHDSDAVIGLFMYKDGGVAIGNTIRGVGSYGGYGIWTNDIASAVIKGNTIYNIAYASGAAIAISAGSTGTFDVVDNVIKGDCVRGIDIKINTGGNTVNLLGNRVADGGGYLVLSHAGPTINSEMNIYEADDFSTYEDTAADLILNP